MGGSVQWICPDHQVDVVQGSGEMHCARGHGFPVIDGIPRFVSASNYADHFGSQWNRYRTTQLDSYTHLPLSRARLRRCMGEQVWKMLADKTVLECGCGAGRFTEVLLAEGANVTSIDLSTAVDANAENFPINEFHRVAQADIMRLPLRPKAFEIVLCLGVIQHTPDPEATISCLYNQVATGGTLVIDHYAYTVGWYTKTAPLIRACVKRLPPRTAMSVTEWLVDVCLPLHKWAAHKSIARPIVHRISPVLSYYVVYPEFSDLLQREWALLDTHDSLTDRYKHFRTRGQVRRMLEALGLEEIWCEYGGNGIEARGRRSAAPRCDRRAASG